MAWEIWRLYSPRKLNLEGQVGYIISKVWWAKASVTCKLHSLKAWIAWYVPHIHSSILILWSSYIKFQGHLKTLTIINATTCSHSTKVLPFTLNWVKVKGIMTMFCSVFIWRVFSKNVFFFKYFWKNYLLNISPNNTINGFLIFKNI